MPSSKKGESWVETVKTIIYALLIAVVIRTFLFQPFNIPSGSMESTLLVGDYLFVEKFAYGYSRYSFPFGGWPLGSRCMAASSAASPQRGDVVVFKMPNAGQFHRLHQAGDRPAGRPHPDDERRALSQRQAGAARCASPIMSSTWTARTRHCAAVSRDPAGRQKLSRRSTDHRRRRWTTPRCSSCRRAIIS